MGQFVPRNFEVILERMINRVVARTDLTDINDGSSLKQVLSAAAREDDDAYFQMINLRDLFDIDKAIGADLDERAKEFNPSLISRNEAAKATGEVVFSRVGTVGVVTIPIGTQVIVPATGAQDDIVFTTTSEGTITGGSTNSNDVDIAADEAGTVGNVGVNTITGFVTKPSGVDTVTNTSALTNGLDEESDDAFRQRLKNQIKGLARAHVDGLETAALTAEDTTTGKRVVFAQVVEDVSNLGNVTLYIDDGAGTTETGADAPVAVAGELPVIVGGETVLFTLNKPIKIEVPPTVVRAGASPNGEPTGTLTKDTHYTLNPASGQINFLPIYFPVGLITGDTITLGYTHFVGLIQETQKIIDGDAGDRATYPGYRAAGVLVRVLSPSIKQQIVRLNITVLQGFNQTDVASQVSSAISGYINALGISEDVVLNELRERAMAIPGMFDLEFVSPTENQVVLDNEIARVLDSNITIS